MNNEELDRFKKLLYDAGNGSIHEYPYETLNNYKLLLATTYKKINRPKWVTFQINKINNHLSINRLQTFLGPDNAHLAILPEEFEEIQIELVELKRKLQLVSDGNYVGRETTRQKYMEHMRSEISQYQEALIQIKKRL